MINHQSKGVMNMASVEGIKNVEMEVPVFAFNSMLGADVVTVVTAAPTMDLFQEWFDNLPAEVDETFSDIRMINGLDVMMYAEVFDDLDKTTVIVTHQSHDARDHFAQNQRLEVVSRSKAISHQGNMEMDKHEDAWMSENADVPLGELHGLNDDDPFDKRTEEQKEQQEQLKKAIKEAEKRGTLTGDSWGGSKEGGVGIQGAHRDDKGNIDVSGVFRKPAEVAKKLAKTFHLGGKKYRDMFMDASPRNGVKATDAIKSIRSKITNTIGEIDNLDMDVEEAQNNFVENFDKVVANFVSNNQKSDKTPDELLESLMSDLEEYSKSYMKTLPEKKDPVFILSMKGNKGPQSGRDFGEVRDRIEKWDDDDEFCQKVIKWRGAFDDLVMGTIDKIYDVEYDEDGFVVSEGNKEEYDSVVGFDITEDFYEEFDLMVISLVDRFEKWNPDEHYDKFAKSLDPFCETYVAFIKSILFREKPDDDFSMDDVNVVRGQHESSVTLVSEDEEEEKPMLSPEEFFEVLAGDGSTTLGHLTGSWNTPDPERVEKLKKDREEEQKQMRERAEQKAAELEELPVVSADSLDSEEDDVADDMKDRVMRELADNPIFSGLDVTVEDDDGNVHTIVDKDEWDKYKKDDGE